MAGAPLELPAFIRLQYAQGEVFSRLKNEAADVTGTVRRSFEDLGTSIDKALNRSVRSGSTAGLDLGVGELRNAVRAHEALATAAEQTARAARVAAQGAGVEARELLLVAQAADAKAASERAAATAAEVHASVLGKVEAELLREAKSIDSAAAAMARAGAANDNGARSAGSHRMAMIGLGQQMQDAVIQAQMGTSALTIFAQQGSQAAFALSGMGGAVGAVARTLAGPWGAAVFAGTALLGPLISGLFDTSDAMDQVKFSSDAVSSAQGVLGGVMDIATGKVNTQSQALLGLARAQLAVARVQSLQKANEARATIKDQSTPAWYEYFSFTDKRSPEQFRRDRASMLGVGDALSGNSDLAIRRLEDLLKAGKINQDRFNQLAAAYANLGIEDANAKVYDQAEKLLDGTGGRELLKPKTSTSRPKVDHSADKAAAEAKRLRKASDSAAEAVARINDRFDAAPKLIDQAASATRDLDAIITELSHKDPVRFADTIKDAQAAKAAVQESLLRPITDAEQSSERRLKVQELLARGRDDEAAGLQAIWQLEDRIGSADEIRAKVAVLTAAGRKEEAEALQALLDKMPAMARRTAEVAEAEARKTRELERQKELFDAQLAVLDQAKSSLTDLLSGRKTDLFGNLKQSLKDLQGKQLFDSLFGDAFAAIDDQLRQRTPLGKATAGLETGVNSATTSIDKFAGVLDKASDHIDSSLARQAANDNSNGFIDSSGAIYVTRNRTTPSDGSLDVSALVDNRLSDMNFGLSKHPFDISGRSIVDMATKLSGAITQPFQEILSQTFGTQFGQMLGGVMSGVIAGKMTGGTTGGILGGLKGIVDKTGIFGGEGGAVSGALKQAMGGAAIGSLSAGIMKSIGIKTSTTGSQIGGAIGSFVPIPGGEIIGSVIGGLLGGAFKKTDKGYARISIGDDGSLQSSLAKVHGSGRAQTATDQANAVYASLQQIADQFGTGLTHNFNLGSIGTYKKQYTYDPTPGTKADTQYFNDAESAVKAGLKSAIERGVIQGMRDSTKRIIAAGNDFDAALQDAVDWENAFKELRAYKDPIGAAIEDLNKSFEHLIDLAKTAGASTEEMAQLEELYGIKRNEIIVQKQKELIGSLQDLYNSLTVGDSGLSLRTREANALAVYNPLAKRVAAGDTTAYDDYAKAAQDLLDIERQLYGSQQEYFDRLGQITDLTKTRVSAETNVTSIAKDSPSPFDAAGQVSASINNQTDALSTRLDALNTNAGATNATLARIEAALTASGRSTGWLSFASSY